MRQIDVSTYKSIESTETIANTALIAVMIVFLLVICCAGPLLPTWMFLNSMQLIFHVPLIKSDLPAHAHFFMVEYLKKLRLHFDWTNEYAESVVGSPAEQDYDVIEQNTFYTAQIKDCGYHYSFLNNLFAIICIALVIMAVWLLLLLKDCAFRACSKKQHRMREPFLTNF